MKVLHIIYALLVAFIWATAYFFQKELVLHVPAYFAISVEALLIAIVLIPFYPKPVIPLKENLFLSLVWGVFTYGFVLTAAKLGIDASVAVVVGKLNVIFAIIFSIIWCKEKLENKAIIGILVSFVGLLLLLRTPNVLENPIAFLFMIGFSISWGIYNAYIKYMSIKYNKKINPIALIAWVAMFATPQTFLLSFVTEDWSKIAINTTSIICLVMLALFGTCIALILWAFLIQRNPMHKIAPFVLLVPIIGVAEAHFFSNEVITTFHILSVTFIVIGIFLTLYEKSEEPLTVSLYANEKKI